MKYLAKTKTRVVTQNDIITPENFGGWYAQNQGNIIAYINGIAVLPQNYGGGNAIVDFTKLDPSVLWGEDITVTFAPHNNPENDNPRVVFNFIKYTEI